MQNRRDMLGASAKVAALLATLGLTSGPVRAQAAGYNSAAFSAKTMAEVMKSLGAGTPVTSKEVTITGPDIAENGAVVPHFHIPLQCGDTQVLKDMNRRYTQDDYLRLCDKLYSQLDDLTITTDIMVGFPTETAQRFESSVAVCEHVKYLKAHIFRFSPRFGTPADQWGDPVTPQDKQERSKRLMEITNRTMKEQINRFLGSTHRVLVERKAKDGLLEGTTDNWLTVKFAGSPSLVRTLQYVRLDEQKDGTVYGELATSTEPNRKLIPLVTK